MDTSACPAVDGTKALALGSPSLVLLLGAVAPALAVRTLQAASSLVRVRSAG